VLRELLNRGIVQRAQARDAAGRTDGVTYVVCAKLGAHLPAVDVAQTAEEALPGRQANERATHKEPGDGLPGDGLRGDGMTGDIRNAGPDALPSGGLPHTHEEDWARERAETALVARTEEEVAILAAHGSTFSRLAKTFGRPKESVSLVDRSASDGVLLRIIRRELAQHSPEIVSKAMQLALAALARPHGGAMDGGGGGGLPALNSYVTKALRGKISDLVLNHAAFRARAMTEKDLQTRRKERRVSALQQTRRQRRGVVELLDEAFEVVAVRRRML